MVGVGNPVSNSPAVSLLHEDKLRARVGVLSEIERKYEQRAITYPLGQKLIIDYKLGETDANGAPLQIGAGVFDRNKDPHERSAIDDPELLKSMLIDFNTLQKRYSPRNSTHEPQTGITDDTIEQLKSLGYLQ